MPNLSDYLLPDGRYYFDNAATTKMSKEALKVYNETADKWFMNPMSYKNFDSRIDELLNDARNHVIEFLGGNADTDRVIFTSGATESINLLLKGYFFANFHKKKKIITSKIEHKAVLETCNYLETIGAEIEYVDIKPDGNIDYNHLKTLVDTNTLYVCLMHVNNETGHSSNLHEIYTITKSVDAKFFTDTTQSLTKIDVNALHFDACVGSAHKFHGPKGVGFLYLKNNVTIAPVQHGGGQENSLRGGTHNLPGLLAMKEALVRGNTDDYSIDFEIIFDILKKENIKFKQIDANNHILLLELDELNLSKLGKILIYSKGSACNSGLEEGSHVYKQVYPFNKSIIRISL